MNHHLRCVSPHNTVSTVAGGGGSVTDDVGTAARSNMPWVIVVDGPGTIFDSDCANSCIRKVTPADGAAAAARFNRPSGLAMEMDGRLIVTDSGNRCIRKVTPSELFNTVAGCWTGGAGEGFKDG